VDTLSVAPELQRQVLGSLHGLPSRRGAPREERTVTTVVTATRDHAKLAFSGSISLGELMAGVAKLSNGTYQARWRDPERKQRSKNFKRKADADRFLDTVRGDLVRGTYLDLSLSKRTLCEYAEQWRKTQPHRPGTQYLYERTLRLHVYPALGARPMSGILRSDVQSLVHDLSQRLGPKTVENVHRLLAAIFNHALDDGLLQRNPCRRVALPEFPPRVMRLLAADEIWTLTSEMPPRYRALIVLAAASGMRQGELLGLRRDDVDFLRKEVHVRKQLISIPGTPLYLGEPKTKASVRTIPLPDFVLEELSEHYRRYPTSHEWNLVFTDGRDKPIGRAVFHKTFKAARERARVESAAVFHVLRHTYASMLIDQGLNVVLVARRLGHSTPTETLKTYAHLFPAADDDTRGAVEAGLILPTEDLLDADVRPAE